MPKTIDIESLAYRQLTLRAMPDADKAAGPIPVIVATETPVKVYDKTHRKVVSEVLLMSGAELPKQSPMVDSHDGGSKAVVGSLRGYGVAGDELHALAHFSSKRAAQEMRQDVLDGHITDLSVGAERLAETFIDTGDEKTIDGRKFKGPARIVTRWRPFHGAVVDSGADKRSVFTPRAYSDPEALHEEHMNATLREQYETLGMPKDTADDAVVTWGKENLTRKAAQAAAGAPGKTSPDAVKDGVAVELKDADIKREARKAEKDRQDYIRTTVRGANLGDELADTLIKEDVERADVAQRVLTELSKRNKAHGRGGDIAPTGSEHESFRKAALDGLSQRIGWQPAAGEKPAPGSSEFRTTRFTDLARKALEVEGVSTRGMSERDIIGRAFAINSTVRASDGQAYLSSGGFSNLLLDAQNKTLLKSFMDVPTTYQFWTNQGQSVPDFKNINRVRLGEIGNQPTVEENGDYKDMSLSDSKESYFVEKRGSIVSLTWEAMKNDDLGGFSRLVQLQGSAMKRTINRSVYQILFDNPNLSDGVAIFHSSSHGANLVTSAFTVAALNTAYSAMALQTGLNSDVILGVTPRYVVHAPGITGTVWSILNSTTDPAVGGSAVGTSGTSNIYGPNGARRLVAIEEPILAGNDTDSWYLMADPNQYDTVEVTFLQGEETPVFEQESAFIQDAIKYKIRQTWGTKAIDYRGMYKSTG